jgi:hypothetical protein
MGAHPSACTATWGGRERREGERELREVGEGKRELREVGEGERA